MIIIDDDSTDNTYKIAKKISENHKNIKVFTQKNKGPFKLAETYNFALSKSMGDFICILEGDDIWFKNKLERQNNVFLQNEKVVLCWSMVNIIGIDSNKLVECKPKTEKRFFFNTVDDPITEHMYMGECFIPAVSIILRSSILKKIGGFKFIENLPLIDFPTVLELSLHGEFYFIDQPLASWRHYVNQITKSYAVDIRKGMYNASLNHYNRNLDHSTIKKINWQRIESNFTKKLVVVYSRMGRYNLVKKRFKLARKNYYLSIKTDGFNNIIWKFRSIIGIMMSFLRLDVEWLARLFGRVSYK
jgi:glycosyltransferase involved in cell wall biosynthesis